jgi:hypothetical protein
MKLNGAHDSLQTHIKRLQRHPVIELVFLLSYARPELGATSGG